MDLDIENKTDEELVKLTLADQEFFYYLMKRYEEKLLRYISYFSGIDHDSAEDVVQETFLNAYKNLNDFDQAMKFSSWIYRIARNGTIDYLRKNSLGKSVISLENGNDEDLKLIDTLKSDLDVLKEVKGKETVDKVREVIKSLPKDYREVLILRYVEDKDYAEIGDILKKPTGTVATMINRAKSYFKEAALRSKLDTLI